MIRTDLSGLWDLSFTIPDGSAYKTQAPVPGNVEPVLQQLGLIEDYMPADNKFATEIFEGVDDWCYSRSFDVSLEEGYDAYLVFDGIDTIAEVYLNGEKVLDCANMHLQYRIPVAGKLKAQDNELKVVIRSSQLWAREHLHDMFSQAHDAGSLYHSAAHLRKARHQWGWDNAPRLLTSGIILPVYIEQLPVCRFEEVYLYTASVDEKLARIGVSWVYKTSQKTLAGHKLRCSLLDGDRVVYTHIGSAHFVQGTERCNIPRELVELWWPACFGQPKLYTICLEMVHNDQVVATYKAPMGIRTLRLDYTPDLDENGCGEYGFKINGQEIFIRGTNWKPMDPLASLAHQKTAQLKALDMLRDLQCNMVRVWGGGIYEDHVFYDYCDRHGILVWQDFMLACEVPPTDDGYCKVMEEEATFIVKKLRNHPSLAVWCGDNENDEATAWVHPFANCLPSDHLITRKVLSAAVLHHDPYRSYVASSPYNTDRVYKERRLKEKTCYKGEEHLYVPIDNFRQVLRNLKSKFLGETGPINVNAITMDPEIFQREKARAARLWDNPALSVNDSREGTIHQSDYYFSKWRQHGKLLCETYFGRDFSFAEWEDYATAVNVVCGEEFKDIIEFCRTDRPNKTGVLWWSLIDMWPMLFNYSVVDCNYMPKLPYYWIRQSQQEMLLAGVRKEDGGKLGLYAANDNLKAHTVSYSVTAYGQNGSSRVILMGEHTQKPNSADFVCDLPEGEPQMLIIRWEEDGKISYNHVFTGDVSYPVMANWLKCLKADCPGYADIQV